MYKTRLAMQILQVIHDIVPRQVPRQLLVLRHYLR